MALFRPVNRNVHLNVWFSTVAGKPHPSVPISDGGLATEDEQGNPSVVYRASSGRSVPITLMLAPGDLYPVAPLRNIDRAALAGFSPALRFNDGMRRAGLLNHNVGTAERPHSRPEIRLCKLKEGQFGGTRARWKRGRDHDPGKPAHLHDGSLALVPYLRTGTIANSSTIGLIWSGVARFDRLFPEDSMFDYNDLFQWERFITPSIIKIFYWLAIGMSALFGLSGIISGFALMSLHPLAGLLWVIASLIGIGIGVMFARIVSEFILIMFRINEHLGAIRQRGGQMTDEK
jgi:hypothetical protein